MSCFIIWICYDLKIECVLENDSVSISLLVRENSHIDIWKKIRLREIHLKKLVKSIEIIKKKRS